MPIGSSSEMRGASIAERVARRQPALLHRGRGQAGEADHVAHRVDVRHRGAVVLVHGDAAALVGLEAGRAQVERVGRALPAGRVEHRVGGDPLAAREVRDGAAVAASRPPVTALAEAERDAQVAQVVLQRLDDLRRRRTRAGAGAARPPSPWCRARRTSRRTRCRSRRRRPPPASRDPVEVEDAVGVEHRALVERDRRRPGRARCRRRSRSCRP